jgi:plastocyanin
MKMSQNLPQEQRLAVWLTVVLVSAAMAAAVGMAPSAAWANTHALTGMQMMRAPERSSRTVVLKHRHTVHVNIHNLAFGPAKVVVSPGTKIIWTNQDGFQHTTTSDHGVWDSGSMDPSAHFAHVFKQAGTFTYHCTIHPFMLGTVTVAR